MNGLCNAIDYLSRYWLPVDKVYYVAYTALFLSNAIWQNITIDFSYF